MEEMVYKGLMSLRDGIDARILSETKTVKYDEEYLILDLSFSHIHSRYTLEMLELENETARLIMG